MNKDFRVAELKQCIDEIMAEYNSAIKVYPAWPDDPVHAAAVLVEESGEVLKEANNYYWGHKRSRGESLQRMRHEAIQTGAMVLRVLENIERYRHR
jgi:NTP pyrophosphatase (non-canonical NTP hydrolase)